MNDLFPEFKLLLTRLILSFFKDLLASLLVCFTLDMQEYVYIPYRR
jgi:hypothetical protein